MTHIIRSCLVMFLLPALTGLAADDPYGDPTPEGAKVRLGTARMRSTLGGIPSTITPDGKFLVSSGTGGGMTFLDPATGKLVKTVRVEGEFGSPLGFSADGKRSVCGGYQNAFVWETATGKVLAKVERLVPSGDHGVALSAGGKHLAIGGSKGFSDKDKDKQVTAVVWDVDGNKQLTTVTPAQQDSVYVAISPDGKRLATWGFHYDRNAKEPPKPENDPARMIQFWDTSTGKETGKARILTGYNPAVVAFSPDGTLAAASAGEGSVHLFDPATGASMGVLLGRARQGRRLAFSPDGKVLAAGGEDGSVQRWSLPDGKRLSLTESPVPQSYAPRTILLFDSERGVAWGSRGLVAFVWELPSGKLLSAGGGHYGSITGATVVAGGKEIITSDNDGTLIRWEAATGKELGRFGLKTPTGTFGPGFATSAVRLSPDGTKALASDSSGGTGIYDLVAGTQQFLIPGNLNLQTQASFTPDSAKLLQVSSSFDYKKNPAQVVVWDLGTAKKTGQIEVPGFSSVSVAVSPDGKSLVTAGVRMDDKGSPQDLVVTGWDLAGGKKLGEYTEEGGFGSAYVGATGDNKSAVVFGPKGTVSVVDFTTGKKTREIDLENKRAGSNPVVSPDGKTLAVPLASTLGPNPTSSVLIVDLDSGKVKKTLSGISGGISHLAFSGDGKTLITGGYDTTALVWDLSGP